MVSSSSIPYLLFCQFLITLSMTIFPASQNKMIKKNPFIKKSLTLNTLKKVLDLEHRLAKYPKLQKLSRVGPYSKSFSPPYLFLRILALSHYPSDIPIFRPFPIPSHIFPIIPTQISPFPFFLPSCLVVRHSIFPKSLLSSFSTHFFSSTGQLLLSVYDWNLWYWFSTLLFTRRFRDFGEGVGGEVSLVCTGW